MQVPSQSVEQFEKFHTGIIGPHKVYYRNSQEFELISTEVFDNQEYAFMADREDPLIIDCGAHIGLTSLYFKQQYPKSTIIAFEPDVQNVAILRKNIEENQLDSINVVAAAVWKDDGNAAMYQEATDSKSEPFTWGNTLIHNIWGDGDEVSDCLVKTVRLSQYITGPVDYLKMDIEGAEEQVLNELTGVLKSIQQMRIEFHGTNTTEEVNSLNRILKLLNDQGFETTVQSKDVMQACRPQTIARVDPILATISAKQ
jgi:FkbM family methyltransferase